MTRADLVARMAQAAGWPRAASDRALRTMLTAVRAALRRGEPVTLVGFGTFSVARRRLRASCLLEKSKRCAHQSSAPS